MGEDKLLNMANQIALGLRRRKDPEHAVAEHINAFWEPRMRDALLKRVQSSDDGAQELLLKAMPFIKPST